MRVIKTIIPNNYKLNLIKHSRNEYSANGEDGIIEKIFESLSISKGVACEFGAWDGMYKSNTFNLVKNHDWKCYMIEADPVKFEELKKTSEKYRNIVPINEKVGYNREDKTTKVLDEILRESKIKKDFDLLSIDIDSCDYQVWQNLLNYKPKLVVIEYSGIYNNIINSEDAIYKLDIDGTTGFIPFYKLGKEKGYDLICDTGNLFFLRRDVLKKLENVEDLMYKNAFFKKIKNIATVDLNKISFWARNEKAVEYLQEKCGNKPWKETIRNSLIKYEKCKSVLDVGAGVCTEYFELKKMNSGIDYTAIEVSENLINFAKENKINIVKAHSNEIPFNDETFDAVLCYDLIEHQESYFETILELIRVAKKIVIITLFNPVVEQGEEYLSKVKKYESQNLGVHIHSTKTLKGIPPELIAEICKEEEEVTCIHHFVSYHVMNSFLIEQYGKSVESGITMIDGKKTIVIRKKEKV